MSGQDKIYELITERMVAELEKGVVPWRKPWATAGSGYPRNVKSSKAYRGINVFLLATTDHASPWWGTYDQMAERAGMAKVASKGKRGYRWESPDGTPRGVRQGETSEVIVFWKRIPVTEVDPGTGDRVKRFIPMLRYYRVFNAEQVDGLPERYFPGDAPETAGPDAALRAAQEILTGYLARDGAPGFREDGGNRAYYGLERDDNIHVPAREWFPEEREYYSTALHEATHSTGHPKRCDRPGVRDFDHFGSGQYAKEELVAEMGAAMLMATAGIASKDTFENSAAYVGHWVGRLRDDHKLVVQAAAQAQRAADYILGTEFENDDDD